MTRAAVFSLLLLFAPVAASAQIESDFGAGSRLVGAGVLFHNDAIRSFSTRICPGSELAAEVGGGILVSKWLAASAFGRVHGEVFADECLNGLGHPPPDSGTLVFDDDSSVEGYPYLSTGLRVTAFSGPPRGGAFRVYAGGEYLWGKSIVAPLVGFGLSIPVQGVLLVAEAERRFISVPFEHVEITYRQGQPISETRVEHHRKAERWGLPRRRARLRLGPPVRSIDARRGARRIGPGNYATSSPTGGDWTVYSPDGHEAGCVRLPDGLRPVRIAASSVVGIRYDALGVESVAVHPLRRQRQQRTNTRGLG